MDVVSTILLFVPILLVLWLANLSHKRRIEGDARNERTLKLLSYGLLFLLYAAMMFFGLGLLGIGLVGVLAPEIFDAQSLAAPGFPADRLPWMGGALVVFSLLGLFLLTRPARRLFARFTPIDPTHPVHAVALSMSAMVLINLAFTVAIGLENLADMVQTTAQAGVQSNPAPALWAQNLTFLVMGLIGVGVLARRSLRAALIRLGIVVPTVRQVILGVGVGLVMVPLVIAAEALATKIGFGTSAGVERLTEQLVGPLTQNIAGILTLGLAAALGEETVFRGALLPRFGLVFTSVLFALLHSQYGLSFSTVAVFVVGLVLGLIRLRANTTTSMITHAVYNMSLGLITFLGLMQNT
ncbi:MAG: lysostaphin resistance A-like protein [Nitrososphaerales archaeon]